MKTRKIITIVAAAIASVVLLVAVAGRLFLYWFWSEWDLSRTANHFRQNQARYEQLVQWAKTQFDQQSSSKPPAELADLANKDFAVSREPFVMETAPINFYYVLVFADSDSGVRQSEALKDEGAVVRRLGNHWVIVRRGWM